ncbi:MAG: class I SAM-dependent methyltransferase [Desulfobulbaceae bacterium]|nr:class I SAM-dependent methyltransferase [Desulfobulbaceae bacterium]
MSTVFGDYSRYYSLLNRDKDYQGEVAYLLKLVAQHANQPARELLDLGCGTGGHAFFLAAQGFAVTGVDRSAAMLAEANQQLVGWSGPGEAPQFLQGDITTLHLGRKFPLVLSLFHVLSYQVSDAALAAALHTAAAHLAEGGLFIFDFWYGPAVEAERPELRIREVEDELLHIRRRAEPVMHQERHSVDVNFTVEITRKQDGLREVLQETHEMRYLFLPEVESFLHQAGLRLLAAGEWRTNAPPSPATWSVCVVAQREAVGSTR